MPRIIHHLVWNSDWIARSRDGLYKPESLESEGFVHCTREPQMLLKVADQFFGDVRSEPLLCLVIDAARLASPVRDEDPGIGHLFPHVYGPIEHSAVVEIVPMKRAATGWALPDIMD